MFLGFSFLSFIFLGFRAAWFGNPIQFSIGFGEFAEIACQFVIFLDRILGSRACYNKKLNMDFKEDNRR